MLIEGSFDEAIEQQRELEEYLAESDAIRVRVNMSFTALCKKFEIPHELQDTYFKWLMGCNSRVKGKEGQPRFKEKDFPRIRGKYLKPGMLVPPPYGADWQKLVEDRGSKWKTKYINYEAAQMAERAVHCVREAIRAATAIPYLDKEVALEADPVKREELIAHRVELEANKANDADLCTKAAKKGVHAYLLDRLTGYEIFKDEDAEKWSKEKAELNAEK